MHVIVDKTAEALAAKMDEVLGSAIVKAAGRSVSEKEVRERGHCIVSSGSGTKVYYWDNEPIAVFDPPKVSSNDDPYNPKLMASQMYRVLV